MRRATRWLLNCHYYYALLVGLLRFRYDFHSDHAYTTRAITLYSVAVNALVVACLPWLYGIHMRMLQGTKTPQLLQTLFVYMRILHILAVLVTVFSNWLQRDEIVAVVTDFNRLRRRYFNLCELPPRLERRFERRIVTNILAGLLVDALQLSVTLDAYGVHDWSLLLGNVATSLLTNMLYVVMNHYYLAIQSAILYAHMLNAQLADILQAASGLARARRRQLLVWHFSRRCRLLASELDELAAAHALLLQLVRRINAMFEIQGGCVVFNMYVHNVCIIYMGYTCVRFQSFVLSTSVWSAVALGVALVLYYLDLRDFLAAVLEQMQVFRVAGEVLRQHLPLPPLDGKLERSLNDLNLQLVRNPPHLTLLGLFDFNNEMAFSMFASTVSYSIILMQYDYQNY